MGSKRRQLTIAVIATLAIVVGVWHYQTPQRSTQEAGTMSGIA